MEIKIHLQKNETENDINTLTLLNAVIKFIKEHNINFYSLKNHTYIPIKEFGELAIKISDIEEKAFSGRERRGLCEE